MVSFYRSSKMTSLCRQTGADLVLILTSLKVLLGEYLNTTSYPVINTAWLIRGNCLDFQVHSAIGGMDISATPCTGARAGLSLERGK